MSAGLTYILVIAVENYLEPKDFPEVNFAKKDAEDLINAFKDLGYDDSNFTILINEKATSTNILQRVKRISERAHKNDRIIIYFAGHGFYEQGQNLLAPVDAIKTDKIDTCISVSSILGYLKESQSTQQILFFDCCHSGFEAGDLMRDGEDSFETDELIYEFSKEEFCVGFASCTKNQTSVSLKALQNGVWTHFLLKALRGEVNGLYNNGLLFSEQLQEYLNKNVARHVKLNTVQKLDQTPIKFGSQTNQFIIADINPLLQKQKKVQEKSEITFVNISMLSEESDEIRTLPGFQRGFHKVPNNHGKATDNFVKTVGAQLIADDIEELSKKIHKLIKYKRADMRVTVDFGSGSIETKDFDYNINIEQSEDNPEEYILTRRLENLKNPEIASSEVLNRIFDSHFDKISFETDKHINISTLIDRIEALDNPKITVDYTPGDMSECIIEIEGLEYAIQVNPVSINITSEFQTSPEELIQAFNKTRVILIKNPELKLLN